jgi:uncharacterized protein YbbK (DUF523 family)
MKKQRILVSACLLGENCRYDGKNNLVKELKSLAKYFDFVPICPEVNGGLKIPRNPAEIQEDSVIDCKGRDVTENYFDGAVWAVSIANQLNIKIAILKDGSPACGVHQIHDGHFNGRKIKGMGITASLLSQNGIKVISEDEIETLL